MSIRAFRLLSCCSSFVLEERGVFQRLRLNFNRARGGIGSPERNGSRADFEEGGGVISSRGLSLGGITVVAACGIAILAEDSLPPVQPSLPPVDSWKSADPGLRAAAGPTVTRGVSHRILASLVTSNAWRQNLRAREVDWPWAPLQGSASR